MAFMKPSILPHYRLVVDEKSCDGWRIYGSPSGYGADGNGQILLQRHYGRSNAPRARIQSVELLLQEQMPHGAALQNPAAEVSKEFNA